MTENQLYAASIFTLDISGQDYQDRSHIYPKDGDTHFFEMLIIPLRLHDLIPEKIITQPSLQ
jgi:hypothetical protein